MSPADPAAAPRLIGRNLAIRRGDRLLFQGLSFDVPAGEIMMLRGPNGSGKTSLLLAILGTLRPESGEIARPGDGGEAPATTHMHFLSYQTPIKPRLSVAENLDFWRLMLGGGGTVDAALAHVGLSGLKSLPAGYLSAGQQKRLGLARLLVAPRKVWLLDEPAAGLDADGDAMMRMMIEAHLSAGGIAVAATHDDMPFAIGTRTQMLTIGAPKGAAEGAR
jgi:heme exporter protein A